MELYHVHEASAPPENRRQHTQVVEKNDGIRPGVEVIRFENGRVVPRCQRLLVALLLQILQNHRMNTKTASQGYTDLIRLSQS